MKGKKVTKEEDIYILKYLATTLHLYPVELFLVFITLCKLQVPRHNCDIR